MHIFDMDGTLIDSNGIWREVDEAFLAKRGFPYTKEYYQGVAHTIFPLAAEFTKRYCHLEESVEDIMAEWMEMAGDAYATRVQVKPGVREYPGAADDGADLQCSGPLPGGTGASGTDAIF